MSASKYLPPFTTEERVTIAGDRSVRGGAVEPGVAVAEPEVTYADFLGDEVDEVDEVHGVAGAAE
ncbi:hypothetical protein Q7F20_11625 [Curtobacterium sp. A7_M15]|uniref:hypothetical protein n=1 Tax=Curtobacterium sp. A7_M15 TaxID=3065241 RepID=UPI002737F401|nr:hypothetical protein [Curtobacterium sp. A7_M15]MDP4334018.1 hypothetical protein [Curtobacterium sp. A7_M15]